MKITKLLMLTVLVAIATTVISQNTYAQRRRGNNRVVVVKRPNHRVVVRKAHVRYGALPRWGATFAVRPSNAVLIGNRGNGYYHSNGIFYRQQNNNYIVVRPARGIRLRVLPIGFRTIKIGPRNYYYYYGTYYAKTPTEYVVVNAPTGAVVDALPDGYEVKTVDGNEYYFLDGVYYAEVDADEFDDKIGYEVVEFK